MSKLRAVSIRSSVLKILKRKSKLKEKQGEIFFLCVLFRLWRMKSSFFEKRTKNYAASTLTKVEENSSILFQFSTRKSFPFQAMERRIETFRWPDLSKIWIFWICPPKFGEKKRRNFHRSNRNFFSSFSERFIQLQHENKMLKLRQTEETNSEQILILQTSYEEVKDRNNQLTNELWFDEKEKLDSTLFIGFSFSGWRIEKFSNSRRRSKTRVR